MQTHQLKRIHPNTKRMIVARGGKRGKTAGRGGKGQSARAGNKRRPEWRDIIKKLPKLRGRGVNSNKGYGNKPSIINIADFEANFSANDVITPVILVEKGLISLLSGRVPSVKILGDGEITKAFKISGCTVSVSAKEKITKAGGSIVELPSRILVKAQTEAQIKKAAMPKKEKKVKEAADPSKTKEVVEKKEKKPKAVKKEVKSVKPIAKKEKVS